MAGFFGLFNYDKEGPGVPKNGPKKKTFVVFFETFFRNFWKFIPINVVYWLVSVPILTNGMANVGLTHVARNTARNKHSFGLSDFFETIKKNLKQALVVGIINVVVLALLIFDLWFFGNMKGGFGVVGNGIAMAILATWLMMNFYMWTLIFTFDFTVKQIFSISFKLTFLNFKYSFLCLIINILIFGLGFILPVFWLRKISLYVVMIEALLLFCVYPAFNALLIQFCTFPSIKKFIIDPYYKAHPDADIEKRKSLGLEIEEVQTPEKSQPTEEDDDEDDDGVIFAD